MTRLDALTQLPGHVQVDVETLRLYRALATDCAEAGDMHGEATYRASVEAARTRLDEWLTTRPAVADLLPVAVDATA